MPDVHPDELAFLAKIAEHPDYPLPRLVFADWLDERGDRRAAWVRDDDLWEWMKPDAQDPIPGILAALPTNQGSKRRRASAKKAQVAFGKLERSDVDAVREWLQAHPDHWPASEVQQFVAAHPPAKLRSVRALKTKLREVSWVEVWLAVVDLGFHGPAAESAVTALTEAIFEGWDCWPDLRTKVNDSELPVENAIAHTLGKIGSSDAVPLLASVLWRYRESVGQALVSLRADPDIVVKHLSDGEPHEMEGVLPSVLQLTDDPVPVLLRTVQRYPGLKGEEAIYLLGRLGPAAAVAIPTLVELSQLQDRWDADRTREAAIHALAQIRGGA